MKFIKSMTKIVLSLLLLVPVATILGDEKGASFALSDEEIKKLNLSESETAELRQFFDALNNLSPAEKQELEELGKKTEAEMKKKNLDPSNFDDLVKFMEAEGAVPKETARPTPPPFAPTRKVEEPVFEQPKVVPVSSPVDTLTMLNDIIKHLASLHQKGMTHESISRKLESVKPQLYELAYYLHILKSPDLIVLLSSREFMPFHDSLKNLHAALATYEPSIVGRRKASFAEDNPYEVLDVSADATNEEITAAYEKAKKALSPKAIEQHLKDQGADAKTIKKRVKEAGTTFMIIEDAYKELKNPQKRQKIDARLQEKGALESRLDQNSLRAFDSLYRVLSGFYPQSIIRDAQRLLERYKPQEAALARAQLEKERVAYERSKQVTRVSQLPPRFQMPEAPYEEFYRKMAQESYQRPIYPGRPGGLNGMMPPPPPTPPTAAAGGKKEEGKKEGGKKEGGKKEEKGKEESGKEKKGKGKEKTRGIEKKDIEKYSLIAEIEKILKHGDELDKKGAVPVRSKTEEETFPTLKAAIKAADAELTTVSRSAATAPSEDIQKLEILLQGYAFEPLTQELKKLAPGPNKKIDDENLKKEWQEHVFNPYGYKIMEWYNELFLLFTAVGRHTARMRPLHKTKAQLYNLNTPLPDVWAKPAKESGKPAPIPEPSEESVNLGKWRDTIIQMHAYFDNINRAFGLGPVPGGPVKAPKAPAPKEEKEEEDEADDGEKPAE